MEDRTAPREVLDQLPLDPSSVATVIAAAEALVAPSTKDLMAHAEQVFSYSDRKLKPALASTRSRRPLCAGCGFGIRQETTGKVKDGYPYHPNCLRALEDPAFALKTSPRYLAAAVPLMAPRAVEAYHLRAEASTPEEALSPSVLPLPLEDMTTTAVKAASRRKKAG